MKRVTSFFRAKEGRTFMAFVKEDYLIGEFLLAVLLILASILFPLLSNAQKAKDGTLSYSPGSSTKYVLNRYAPLASSAAASATSVTVTDITLLNGSYSFTNSTNPYATSTLSAGDLVMIIQVQGATIDVTNTSTYGAISAYNNVGNYELRTVQSTVGNTIYFCAGLSNAYTVGGTGRAQVVRIPRLNDLTVGTNGIITAYPWDGTSGGVCALEVDRNLVVNGTIDAVSDGFRGGTVNDNSGAIPGSTNIRSTAANDGALKGEGIAGNQTDYAAVAMNGQYCRGAAANGGGGGNGHNCGGGGGANAGNNGNLTPWNGTGIKSTTTGTWANAWNLEVANFATDISRGGGRGGYSYANTDRDALTVPPGNTGWGGDNRQNLGGFGGRPLNYSGNTKLFFGGGGGAGDQNNGAGSNGANGGGIIYLLVTGTVSGTGTITANGGNAGNTVSGHNDAPGGGGGGGAVVILSNSTITGVTIRANGGNGGSQLISGAESEGPGGGGGGGYILTTTTSVTRTVTGGSNGTSSSSAVTEFIPNGATSGDAGTIVATGTFFNVNGCYSQINGGGCGSGFVNVPTSLVTNGNFSLALSPAAGNTFSPVNTSTSGITYTYTGGSFRSQSQRHTDNTLPSTEHGFSIINSSTTWNGGCCSISQNPFPGDSSYAVPASNTWMYHNGNDLGGEYLLWEQTVTGLTVGQTYTFYFYATNMAEPGGCTSSDPLLNIRFGGTSGLPNGTLVSGSFQIPVAPTANATPLSGWQRIAYTFTATGTSQVIKITNAQTGACDDLGITAIGMSTCQAVCTGAGSGSIAVSNTIINTYYPATASAAVGATRIKVGTKRGAGAQDNIQPGDLLLVIQMQGSTINATNTSAYGAGTTTYSGYTSTVAGTYEYVYAASGVVNGTIYLANPLRNAYANLDATSTDGQYRFQVVRVPQYTSLNIASGASITVAEWDGRSGGIVAANVSGTMTLNGGVAINASNLGFRGGGGRQLGGVGGLLNSDARTLSSAAANGSKGEGIAGTPKYTRSLANVLVDNGPEGYPNGSYGQGAPGNAGGGGNDGSPSSNSENTGGGGGGNGGIGGRGGRAWNRPAQYGGYGGAVFNQAAANRLVLGGGGGAGTTNDGTNGLGGSNGGFNSSGGSGGGIVLLKVNAVSGTGTINANGASGLSVDNDGGGAGGAGGSVYIYSTNTAGLANVTINAIGGNGGNAWASVADDGTPNNGNPEHGPGGGGGGGVIYSNGTINAASSVAGGNPGTTTTSALPYGATAGAVGIKLTSTTDPVRIAKVYCDIDDDNDGIVDTQENPSGVDPFLDSDNDGIPNAYDATSGTVVAWADTNGDGINDNFDADKDGKINELDIDSDNDGITDNVEAQATNSYKMPTDTDSDGNGLNDVYELTPGAGGGITPVDTDLDGIPDYLDTDSDGDGAPDRNEGADRNQPTFLTMSQATIDASGDSDGDGLMDVFDNTNNDNLTSNYFTNVAMSNMGPLGNFAGPAPGGSKQGLQQSDPVADRDWRNASILPLHIINFIVNYQTPVATLKWQVENEVAAAQYEVEVSTNATDFTKEGTVTARNRGTDEYVYPYTVTNFNIPAYFFRIKQVGKDGKVFYSKVVMVKLSGLTGLKALPNPFTSSLQAMFSSTKRQQVSVELIAADGRRISLTSLLVNQGNNAININVPTGTIAGTYILRITTADAIQYSTTVIKN
jgi:hypothetical protein